MHIPHMNGSKVTNQILIFCLEEAERYKFYSELSQAFLTTMIQEMNKMGGWFNIQKVSKLV